MIPVRHKKPNPPYTMILTINCLTQVTRLDDFVNSSRFGDAEALVAEALVAVALVAEALVAVALVAEALVAVALDTETLTTAGRPGQIIFPWAVRPACAG